MSVFYVEFKIPVKSVNTNFELVFENRNAAFALK